MLSDPTQSDAFRRSSHWQSPLLNFQLRVQQQEAPGALTGKRGPAYRSNSFSGNERNRLLLAGRDGFEDYSLVSGVDCKEDARSFAMFDYDKDGWLDIALASVSAPRLRLFRNRGGDQGAAAGGRVVEVHLVGGNRGAAASRLSNRDACGAVLTAVTSRGQRQYRRGIGEGLSSQNAAAIRVTLAADETLKSLSVRWPSGKVTNEAVPEVGGAVVIEEL